MHSIITKTVWKSGMAVVTSNAVALGGTTPDIVIQLLYFVVQAHVPPTGGGKVLIVTTAPGQQRFTSVIRLS